VRAGGWAGVCSEIFGKAGTSIAGGSGGASVGATDDVGGVRIGAATPGVIVIGAVA
jgi:hypothetical protein